MHPSPALAEPSNANRRRSPREDVTADTLMSDGEGRLSGLKLLNLSADGFMGLADVNLREREPIRVDMPALGWVEAEVVWVLGDRVGGAFRASLTPHDLRAVLDDVTR